MHLVCRDKRHRQRPHFPRIGRLLVVSRHRHQSHPKESSDDESRGIYHEYAGVGVSAGGAAPGPAHPPGRPHINHIPKSRQTMNLEGFTMNTPESEYRRVVRHETGHTLGFPHEHMRKALVARIDPQKAYDYFLRTQGWPKDVVDQQVLTSLNEASLMATPPDQTSIMCYQLPGSITRDGKPIIGGLDINQTDFTFVGKIYPKGAHAVAQARAQEDYWEESEDVDADLESA